MGQPRPDSEIFSEPPRMTDISQMAQSWQKLLSTDEERQNIIILTRCLVDDEISWKQAWRKMLQLPHDYSREQHELLKYTGRLSTSSQEGILILQELHHQPEIWKAFFRPIVPSKAWSQERMFQSSTIEKTSSDLDSVKLHLDEREIFRRRDYFLPLLPEEQMQETRLSTSPTTLIQYAHAINELRDELKDANNLTIMTLALARCDDRETFSQWSRSPKARYLTLGMLSNLKDKAHLSPRNALADLAACSQILQTFNIFETKPAYAPPHLPENLDHETLTLLKEAAVALAQRHRLMSFLDALFPIQHSLVSGSRLRQWQAFWSLNGFGNSEHAKTTMGGRIRSSFRFLDRVGWWSKGKAKRIQ
ncbi:hypothetical protein LTR20_007352 [Exophiala xenobiotica]|nr:hypothetical protein LTS06_008055 [Exophiala xenobiotica]KAK5283516.1 hypothetical protein LTR40_001659 [Exophiala xenobiotica]KAK5371041.1 hypothetical protein LTS13_006418 [Exophiala xenobiotica]KAK5401214.1 hypothetical protein LTR79_001733 [Exophiala xenobiotica]KAK5409143.1 hypothetical protein LTR90_009266 [Exophiala xenobiotica]